MSRQFVEVRFRAADRRTYTYHNDAAPVRKGESVAIQTKRGKVTAEVISTTLRPPSFETKAILGLAAPPETLFDRLERQDDADHDRWMSER